MYSKTTIIGRLGNDPELRFMPNQTPVATLSVATSETWKDKATGERKERTEWHRVVIFGALAEVAGKYLRKGAVALFEGQTRTRQWQGQDGIERYSTELHANEMKMLPSGSSQNGAAATSSASAPATPPADRHPAAQDDFFETYAQV